MSLGVYLGLGWGRGVNPQIQFQERGSCLKPGQVCSFLFLGGL